MKLTSLKLKSLPIGKSVCDGAGLYIRLTTKKSGNWSFKYMRGHKSREMGLGPYPEVTLQEARIKRDKLKIELAAGKDPLETKRSKAKEYAKREKMRFSLVAELVIHNKRIKWTCPKQEMIWRNTLERYAFPLLDQKPIADLTRQDVINVLNPIWNEKHDTARKLLGRIARVFGHAKARGWYRDENPALWKHNLDEVFSIKAAVKHHEALDYRLIPDFYLKLHNIDTISSLALRYTILTAARTGEVRFTNREELDLDKALWSLSPNRMKARKKHNVPLSSQAVSLIKQLSTHNMPYIFPGLNPEKPMSNGAMHQLIRKRFKTETFTVHGFRSSFRDWAGENGDYAHNVIEFSLAHQLDGKTEGAYLRSELLEKRRILMQDWADFVTQKCV
jgi:integrase